MLIKINPEIPVPLYQQIIDQIKILIDRGDLDIGQSLPPSRKLAAKLGVNRSTVVRAYEELLALGYLSSRPGSYHRVKKRRREVPYSPERKSLISWKKAANFSADLIYKIFLRYFPEGSDQVKNQSGMINISQLDLDHRLYPLHEFKQCMDTVLLQAGSPSLEYGDHQGYPLLRQHIARRLRLHGICVSEDEILITNGAQQALDLIIRMLNQKEKTVVMESPTYAAAIPLFKFNNTKIAGIPVREDGMDLERLDSVLQTEKASFVYTIPNFHNPTGLSSSHQHREKLLNLCVRYMVPLVEDGFEEDMKYFGKVPLPIKSIDEKNIVIYIGTFSKTLFPGLRIGWATADKECIKRLTAIKRFSDLGSGKLVQMAICEFLKRGYYDKQLKRLHREFRKRMQVALRTMDETFPPTVSWTQPSGGYTIWVKMPWTLTENQLNTHMSKHGVVISSGNYYFSEKTATQHFRISLAKSNQEEIIKGIRRLGKALYDLDKKG